MARCLLSELCSHDLFDHYPITRDTPHDDGAESPTHRHYENMRVGAKKCVPRSITEKSRLWRIGFLHLLRFNERSTNGRALGTGHTHTMTGSLRLTSHRNHLSHVLLGL